MSPYEQAMEVYAREPSVRTFDLDLQLHHRHGFVFSTPEFFIMGRAVVKSAEPRRIVDPTHLWPKAECDCWHIYLMAGDHRAAWSIMPWPLPWFSFERKNELRLYPVSRIKRLSLGAEALTMP